MASPVDELAAFAVRVGLQAKDIDFFLELPYDVCSQVYSSFSPDGTKDGNVLGRLTGYVRSVLRRQGAAIPASLGAAPAPRRAAEGWQDDSQVFADMLQQAGLDVHSAGAPSGGGDVWAFAEQLRLPADCAEFLAALPQDLAQSVIRGFDPSGTKDGNVWGRLFAYVRGQWARRLRLTEEAHAFIRGCPEEAQIRVILEFDAAGSKDGNVSARLIGFARRLSSGSKGAGKGGDSYARPQRSAPAAWPAAQVADPWRAVTDLARNLGLDQAAHDFMQQLPDEVKSAVVTSFDPSGTKDGNVWGRLFGFTRTCLSRYMGWDHSFIDHLKSLPEEQQMGMMLSRPQARPAQQSQQHIPASPAPLGRGADLQGFVNHWGLDGASAQFLQAIPQHIQDVVLSSFDASATKDGNVWGRLLGFVRSTWGRSLNLDQETLAYIKGMPEEAQMMLITDFDPSGTKDGNVSGRLMGFAKKAMAMTRPGAPPTEARPPRGSGDWQRTPAVLDEAAAIDEFIHRCGLDSSAMALLQPLSPDVLALVLNNFDPRGTKDGNVMGRLEGYVRAMSRRRPGAGLSDGGAAKRARLY
eukprot:gb/GFBE01068062.1/.p1 GENE.gb/GFBE01068062.1/~~gb/GFBE01068062.1/.p1  ORF type:complete len:580 (+),score=114.61 gb/GFBE01068062.1/:1-1740(+)